MRLTARLVLLLIFFPALAACDTEPPALPTAGPSAVATSRTFPVAANDLQYIEMMVPHHQLAVDMSSLALKKAVRGEIKGIAADIFFTQADEIRRMNLWRVELGGAATPADPHSSGGHGDMPDMPGMDVDMDALAASNDFDRDFARAMIEHHQAAIDMSRASLPNLRHLPLRHLAEDIISTQQLEIDRMRGWLEEWK